MMKYAPGPVWHVARRCHRSDRKTAVLFIFTVCILVKMTQWNKL